ncbi:hypothetical protein BC831DRAFT_311463 [Entophlyctis helioformis]|nr:hypothetical protein BC831DRAFT_311463 [Entophlyctis helioformis]
MASSILWNSIGTALHIFRPDSGNYIGHLWFGAALVLSSWVFVPIILRFGMKPYSPTYGLTRPGVLALVPFVSYPFTTMAYYPFSAIENQTEKIITSLIFSVILIAMSQFQYWAFFAGLALTEAMSGIHTGGGIVSVMAGFLRTVCFCLVRNILKTTILKINKVEEEKYDQPPEIDGNSKQSSRHSIGASSLSLNMLKQNAVFKNDMIDMQFQGSVVILFSVYSLPAWYSFMRTPSSAEFFATILGSIAFDWLFRFHEFRKLLKLEEQVMKRAVSPETAANAKDLKMRFSTGSNQALDLGKSFASVVSVTPSSAALPRDMSADMSLSLNQSTRVHHSDGFHRSSGSKPGEDASIHSADHYGSVANPGIHSHQHQQHAPIALQDSPKYDAHGLGRHSSNSSGDQTDADQKKLPMFRAGPGVVDHAHPLPPVAHPASAHSAALTSVAVIPAVAMSPAPAPAHRQSLSQRVASTLSLSDNGILRNPRASITSQFSHQTGMGLDDFSGKRPFMFDKSRRKVQRQLRLLAKRRDKLTVAYKHMSVHLRYDMAASASAVLVACIMINAFISPQPEFTNCNGLPYITSFDALLRAGVVLVLQLLADCICLFFMVRHTKVPVLFAADVKPKLMQGIFCTAMSMMGFIHCITAYERGLLWHRTCEFATSAVPY